MLLAFDTDVSQHACKNRDTFLKHQHEMLQQVYKKKTTGKLVIQLARHVLLGQETQLTLQQVMTLHLER
jgi:hypothetical protein